MSSVPPSGLSLLFGLLISSLALYTAAPVGSLKYKSLPIINSDAFSSCFILTLAHGLCKIHALLTSLNSFPIAFPTPHSAFSPTSLLAALETLCCSLPPWRLGTGCSLPAVLSPPHPDTFTAHPSLHSVLRSKVPTFKKVFWSPFSIMAPLLLLVFTLQSPTYCIFLHSTCHYRKVTCFLTNCHLRWKSRARRAGT